MQEHRGSRRWSATVEDFTPRRLGSTLATGLSFALVNTLLSIAIISLIFSGPLASELPSGIGIALTASTVLAITIAVLSDVPGVYAGVQDNSAAILGLAAASIASSVAASRVFDSVVAVMVVTSLACGVVFLVMAHTGLGRIVRFVPFPVVGGVLAGTGYLVLGGSLDILWPEATASGPGTLDAAAVLWPGVGLASVFMIASRRGWASRTFLWCLIGGMALFHIVIRVAGMGQQQALAREWLLGPFPDGPLWQGLSFSMVRGADWGAVLGETASIVTVLFVVPITLLLYVSALEIDTKREVDVRAQLRATGWGNLAAALVGGPPGHFFISDTLIAHRLVGARRGPSIVTGLALFGVVLLGGSILEFVPRFVVGGVLMFIGVDFLYEWLWLARGRMSRPDYAIMLAIVLIVATVGFLTGAAAGLVAAIALFVYRYSRTDVVKHQLTAEEHQSNIERPLDHAELIRREGRSVFVLELQGFVFFGTADRVFDHLKVRLASTRELRFAVFDFRAVTGIDSSAVELFERIALFAHANDVTMLLSSLSPVHSGQFSSLVDHHSAVREEPSLDHAMAWCEDRILEGLDVSAEHRRSLPDELLELLDPYLDSRVIPAGDSLMVQGEEAPGIFLITSGRATVLLDDRTGEQVRLRTLLEGTVLGEISLYRGEKCTATVVAELDCEVLHLTPEAFERLCVSDTAAAAQLHGFVARTLAGRLGHANRTIRALQG